MLGRLLALLLTFAALCVGIWLYVEHNRILFTCKGSYQSVIHYPELQIENTSNVVISLSSARKIYVNLEGSIRQNGNQYHISRELTFNYEPVDTSSGLYRILPFSKNVNSTDTVEGQAVDDYIYGIEEKGRVIRVWKLSDDVILIGNPFFPIYSCTLIH